MKSESERMQSEQHSGCGIPTIEADSPCRCKIDIEHRVTMCKLHHCQARFCTGGGPPRGGVYAVLQENISN